MTMRAERAPTSGVQDRGGDLGLRHGGASVPALRIVPVGIGLSAAIAGVTALDLAWGFFLPDFGGRPGLSPPPSGVLEAALRMICAVLGGWISAALLVPVANLALGLRTPNPGSGTAKPPAGPLARSVRGRGAHGS